MKKFKPLVSIIIPTRNSQTVLRSCLLSIKAQTYKPIEIVVVDNHSSDKTLKIAQEFTSRIFTKGPERSSQRNVGVRKAKGEYVLIIDSDMELSPEVVAQCVEKMAQDSNVTGVIIPEMSFGKGFWAECKRLEKSFYVGEDWMEAARFFDRKTYLEIGGYHEGMVSGEDWDLSQRMEKKGAIKRIKAFIYHNEGRLSLVQTIKKKFYYATQFATYLEQNHQSFVTPQTNVLSRYALYFKKTHLWLSQPGIFAGMLFMKTAELASGGLALLVTKVQRLI